MHFVVKYACHFDSLSFNSVVSDVLFDTWLCVGLKINTFSIFFYVEVGFECVLKFVHVLQFLTNASLNCDLT